MVGAGLAGRQAELRAGLVVEAEGCGQLAVQGELKLGLEVVRPPTHPGDVAAVHGQTGEVAAISLTARRQAEGRGTGIDAFEYELEGRGLVDEDDEGGVLHQAADPLFGAVAQQAEDLLVHLRGARGPAGTTVPRVEAKTLHGRVNRSVRGAGSEVGLGQDMPRVGVLLPDLREGLGPGKGGLGIVEIEPGPGRAHQQRDGSALEVGEFLFLELFVRVELELVASSEELDEGVVAALGIGARQGGQLLDAGSRFELRSRLREIPEHEVALDAQQAQLQPFGLEHVLGIVRGLGVFERGLGTVEVVQEELRGGEGGLDVVRVPRHGVLVPLEGTFELRFRGTDGREEHAGVGQTIREFLRVFGRASGRGEVPSIEELPAAVQVGGVTAPLGVPELVGFVGDAADHFRQSSLVTGGRRPVGRVHSPRMRPTPPNSTRSSHRRGSAAAPKARGLRFLAPLYALGLLGCPAPQPPGSVTAPGQTQTIDGRKAPELSRAAQSKAAEDLERARAAEARGDDEAAAAAYDDAASRVAGDAAAARVLEGRRALALVRAGEAREPLEILERLGPGGLGELEYFAARAQVLDRLAEEDTSRAAALAAWFDFWAASEVHEDPAARAFAQGRARTRHAASGPALRAAAYAQTRTRAGRVCLELASELESARVEESWQARCAPAQSAEIGILLPRSGRFAALADRHLAALTVAMRLVTPDQGELELAFEDAGSDEKSAVSAAERLLDRGARTLIGPLGERAAEAVAEAVAGRATVITPGPGRGAAVGVAPTLEARVEALVRAGAQVGCADKGWVVLRSRGNYGDRALAAAQTSTSENSGKGLKRFEIRSDVQYDSKTTSFGPVLDPARAWLNRGSCVIIFDTLGRSEDVARQLRRVEYAIGAEGLRVFSTAEGLDAGAVDGRAALAGLVVAPSALPQAGSTFQAEYRLATGRAADDQALLVWAALRLAIWGEAPPQEALVAQFDQGGNLHGPTP